MNGSDNNPHKKGSQHTGDKGKVKKIVMRNPSLATVTRTKIQALVDTQKLTDRDRVKMKKADQFLRHELAPNFHKANDAEIKASECKDNEVIRNDNLLVAIDFYKAIERKLLELSVDLKQYITAYDFLLAYVYYRLSQCYRECQDQENSSNYFKKSFEQSYPEVLFIGATPIIDDVEAGNKSPQELKLAFSLLQRVVEFTKDFIDRSNATEQMTNTVLLYNQNQTTSVRNISGSYQQLAKFTKKKHEARQVIEMTVGNYHTLQLLLPETSLQALLNTYRKLHEATALYLGKYYFLLFKFGQRDREEMATTCLQVVIDKNYIEFVFEAQYYLALIQLIKDKQKAIPMLEQAIKIGNPTDPKVIQLHVSVGELYDPDPEVDPIRSQKAFAHYQAAADQKDPNGLYNTALMYETGQHVPQNEQEAAIRYRAAMAGGHTDALLNLGRLYELHKVQCPNPKQWYANLLVKVLIMNEPLIYHVIANNFLAGIFGAINLHSFRFWHHMAFRRFKNYKSLGNLALSYVQHGVLGDNEVRMHELFVKIPQDRMEYGYYEGGQGLAAMKRVSKAKSVEEWTASLQEAKEHEHKFKQFLQANPNHDLLEVSFIDLDLEMKISALETIHDQSLDEIMKKTQQILAQVQAVKEQPHENVENLFTLKTENFNHQHLALFLFNLGNAYVKHLKIRPEVLEKYSSKIIQYFEHANLIVYDCKPREIAMILEGVTKLYLHSDIPVVGECIHNYYQAAVLWLDKFDFKQLSIVFFSLTRIKIEQPFLELYIMELLTEIVAHWLKNQVTPEFSWQFLSKSLYTCMLLEHSMRGSPGYEKFVKLVQQLFKLTDNLAKASQSLVLSQEDTMQLFMVNQYFMQLNGLHVSSVNLVTVLQAIKLSAEEPEANNAFGIVDPSLINDNFWAVLGEAQPAEESKAEVVVRSSQLQKTVQTEFAEYFETKYEVTVKGFPIDFVIYAGDKELLVQIDGPSHFWYCSKAMAPEFARDIPESTHKTRINSMLVCNTVRPGSTPTHSFERIAYFKWQGLSKSQKYEYMKALVEKHGIVMPPRKPLSGELMVSAGLAVASTEPQSSAARAMEQSAPSSAQVQLATTKGK